MSVIWSGVTAEGAVVPVQVTAEGKVVAVGDGPQGDYLPTSGGNLTGDLTLGIDKITLNATNGSAEFTKNVVATDGNFQGYEFIADQNTSPYGCFTGKLNGVQTSRILADGSAQFGTLLTLNNDGFGTVSVGDAANNAILGATTSSRVDASVNTTDVLNYRGSYQGNTTFAVGHDGTTKIGGTLPSAPNISLNADGSVNAEVVYVGSQATNLTSYARVEQGRFVANNIDSAGDLFYGYKQGVNTVVIKSTGAATFSGDVIIGSRGEKWLIRESNGVAMLVPQSREAAPMIPEQVRDIPKELDLIEMALNEVMEKLRMTPPAGWPVWDGSDNP